MNALQCHQQGWAKDFKRPRGAPNPPTYCNVASSDADYNDRIGSISVPPGIQRLHCSPERPGIAVASASASMHLGPDQGDDVAHGPQLFGVPIGDLDVELVLERHDGLDHVEAGG